MTRQRERTSLLARLLTPAFAHDERPTAPLLAMGRAGEVVPRLPCFLRTRSLAQVLGVSEQLCTHELWKGVSCRLSPTRLSSLIRMLPSLRRARAARRKASRPRRNGR